MKNSPTEPTILELGTQIEFTAGQLKGQWRVVQIQFNQAKKYGSLISFPRMDSGPEACIHYAGHQGGHLPRWCYRTVFRAIKTGHWDFVLNLARAGKAGLHRHGLERQDPHWWIVEFWWPVENRFETRNFTDVYAKNPEVKCQWPGFINFTDKAIALAVHRLLPNVTMTVKAILALRKRWRLPKIRSAWGVKQSKLAFLGHPPQIVSQIV